MGRFYIDRYTARISREDLYLVRVTKKDGEVLAHLEPRRLFPVTNKDMYITLLDEGEREVGFVRDLGELDEESAAVLTAVFSEYYRVPRITRLLECRAKFGSLTWVVETDRGGPVTFRIRNSHSDIKRMHDGRILVRDTDDNRYEIASFEGLDARSRQLLFSYL